MRTLSLIKVNSIRGALLGVILLLALMMLFVIGAKPSHAASLDGEYKVTPEFSPGVSGVPTYLEATQFELYKVGDFVVGEPYVELYDAPYNKGVVLPLKADQTDTTQWTKEWLKCAVTLDNNIKSASAEDKPEAIPINVDAEGKFHKDGLTNGLYLLRGESQILTDPKTGERSYWWPQPMLISVLNSDVNVFVKPMTGQIHHLKVLKVWQWPSGLSEDIKDIVMPESIKIELYYDGNLKKTVELPQDGNWFYEWDTAVDEADPNKWSVKEVVKEADQKEFKRNFNIEISEKIGDDGILTVTNKYDRPSLKIQKTFDAYVDNGEGNSTSIVFELSGYTDDACENRDYHKFVGLQVDPKSDEQELDVKDIPLGLKHLKVKEVYSGNYKAEGEKEAVLDTDNNLYTVSFENKLDNPKHVSGVVNKFKIKNKDYTFDSGQSDYR